MIATIFNSQCGRNEERNIQFHTPSLDFELVEGLPKNNSPVQCNIVVTINLYFFKKFEF